MAILAALPWERRALLRAAPHAQRLRATPFPTWIVPRQCGGLIIVQSGMGGPHALGAVGWTIDLAPGAALLFFGCAGGLDPELRAGSAVVAETIRSGSTIFSCDSAWRHRLSAAALRAGLSPTTGGVLAATVPLLSAADKQLARVDSGALAVDMESGGLARRATAAGRAFAVGRIILDDAQTTIGSIPAFLANRRLLSQVETGLEAWLREFLAIDSPTAMVPSTE